MKYLFIYIFLMIMISTLNAAGVYKWTDENGQLHFTDKPPPGRTVQHQEVKPASGDGNPSTAGGLRSGERDLLRRANTRDSAQQKALQTERRNSTQELAAKKRACERARERYNTELKKPKSEGAYHKEWARDYYKDMQEACK